MGYVIMVPQKIKSSGQLTRSYDHNLRYRFCENADVTKRGENRQILSRDTTYSDFYKERIKASPLYHGPNAKTIRKDAVRAVDICIAVNKSEAKTNPFFDIDEFCERAKQWVCDTFGEENVAGITLHMDEKAPHLHAIVIPMTKDGRLSCSDFMGTPEKLSHLQDTIAEAMKPLRLFRGQRKSVASHTTMKSFYSDVEKTRVDSLPSPLENETAKQYAVRANESFNAAKAQALSEKMDLRRERDEALTRVRQAESGIRTSQDDINEQRNELEKVRRKLAKNQEALDQWQDIVYAAQHHLLSPADEKQMLGLMRQALDATQKDREREESLEEKK